MIGLNALRKSVASISSASCSRRPLSTASVTGSIIARLEGPGIVALAERQQLGRADHRVQLGKVEHAGPVGLRRAVATQARQIVLRHMGEGANEPAGKDDQREA